ncbi:MAG: bifunctional folylpolyglutamate synthase/dihydrofolate synthase [Firmicutes bacterium]|nr:bifunctional folylpolyglutamate synthase/dihydrofolate synthase [Bacillota bacterium]
MHYQEAMKHIGQLSKFGINLGLSRMERLLGFLGNPERGLRCIHVAGTNGKGSTSAMIASILRESGYRAGLFTSPHLERYTERIQVDSREIPEADVSLGMSRLHPLIEKAASEVGQPTEFEATTALALWYFAREKVDWAVLEVGLGGELDSTNLITPAVTVITNVSLDHTDILGPDIKSIAAAKAGTIKPGVPVVTAAEGSAFEVIEQKALELGSPLIRVVPAGEVAPSGSVSWNWTGNRGQEPPSLTVSGRRGSYPGLTLSLLGRHQAANAAAAIAAVEVLVERGADASLATIARGLAGTFWPGRLELIRPDPPIIVDGAHNLAGAVSLREALDDYYPGRRRHLVLGILKDKDWRGIARVLAPTAESVIVTPPPNPRAGEMEELVEECARLCGETSYEPDNRAAIARGLERVGINRGRGPGPDRSNLLCVTGSLFLVGPARRCLFELLR